MQNFNNIILTTLTSMCAITAPIGVEVPKSWNMRALELIKFGINPGTEAAADWYIESLKSNMGKLSSYQSTNPDFIDSRDNLRVAIDGFCATFRSLPKPQDCFVRTCVTRNNEGIYMSQVGSVCPVMSAGDFWYDSTFTADVISGSNNDYFLYGLLEIIEWINEEQEMYTKIRFMDQLTEICRGNCGLVMPVR